MSKERYGKPSFLLLYTVTIALFVYGWLSVNIYLPVLPQLESIFHTTAASARLTVTIFLLGFSFTQLVWGPLSDRYGRRPVLLAGVAISSLGAVAAALATNITMFAGARLFESIGLGVGPVLARSVLTDSLDRIHVAVAMAYVAVVVAIVPAIAPIIGGYLDFLVGWRGIFVFIALYGATILVVCALRLPETNHSRNPSLTASRVASEYREMLSNRRYVGYISAYGIAFGTLVGYYAAAPFIFITDLGYGAHEYGYLLLFNVAFYVFGAMVARAIIPKLGNDLPIVFALGAYVLTSVILIALDLYTTMNAVSVLLPISVFIFGAGLISPAANAGAMTIFKDKAGAATAVVGFSIALGGALFNGGLSAVHITGLSELGAYIIVSTIASVAVYLTLIRQRSEPARRKDAG